MIKPIVSLCLPTNGIIEWVYPVLDSIFKQNINPLLYEVIVTNNGDNEKFDKRMKVFAKKHENLIYVRTKAKGFLNQIECFKLANGDFVKFINHRALLVNGSIQRFINFAKDNKESKPCVFFANSNLVMLRKVNYYTSFDSYVSGLSYYSSWSGGLAFWKDTELSLLTMKTDFDSLFPHMDILFSHPHNNIYVIDNNLFSVDIDSSHSRKGTYNLFYAFAVHYIEILEDLNRRGYISNKTFLKVKNANQRFVERLYYDFIIENKPCSYDLAGAEESISEYYNFPQVKANAKRLRYRELIKKIAKLFL